MAKITAKHSKLLKLICVETLLALLLVSQSTSADQSQSNADSCMHQSNSAHKLIRAKALVTDINPN